MGEKKRREGDGEGLGLGRGLIGIRGGIGPKIL